MFQLLAALVGAAQISTPPVDHPLYAFWESLEGRHIRRCEPDAPAWKAAQVSLEALNAQVEGLKDPDPIGAVLDRWSRLLAE